MNFSDIETELSDDIIKELTEDILNKSIAKIGSMNAKQIKAYFENPDKMNASVLIFTTGC